MPRCKTAWFSVVMSTLNSVCYHEPSSGLQSFEALMDFWKPVPGLHVGISDSALTLQLDRILETVKPRTLLIERPIPEVLASFRKYLKGAPLMFDYDSGRAYLGEIAEVIEKFRGHSLVRTVSFDDLRDHDTTLDVIRWLAPGVEIMDLRQLMHMNIQADLGYVLGLLAKPHTHWYRKQWSTSAESAPA